MAIPNSKFQAFLDMSILLICQEYSQRNIVSSKMYSVWITAQVDGKRVSHKTKSEQDL